MLSQYEECMGPSKVEDSVHNICTQQTDSVANPEASLDDNLKGGKITSKGGVGPSKGSGDGVDNTNLDNLKKNVKTANYITFTRPKNIHLRVSKFL